MMPGGVVRAFDAHSGALRWSWDTIPASAPAAGNSKAAEWQTGAANAWSIMSVDPQRDLIFVPTGSASPDFYGGLRPNIGALTGVACAQKQERSLWDSNCASRSLDYDAFRHCLNSSCLQRGRRCCRHTGQQNRTSLRTQSRYGKAGVSGGGASRSRERCSGELASPTQPFPMPAPPPPVLQNSHMMREAPQDREICCTIVVAPKAFTPSTSRGTSSWASKLGAWMERQWP